MGVIAAEAGEATRVFEWGEVALADSRSPVSANIAEGEEEKKKKEREESEKDAKKTQRKVMVTLQ